jgi:hypothetical protein
VDAPGGPDPGSSAWPFEIRPDDVYVVSYPRSGNNWMRWMLSLLRDPGLDLGALEANPYTCDPYHRPERLGALRPPRIVKSHAARGPGYPRVVYLYRDGRDCLASHYDFSRRRGLVDGGFADFVARSLHGGLGFASWADHVGGWLLAPPPCPLLAVRYEALLAEPESELARAAAFLGLPADEATVRAAVRGASRETFDRHLARFSPELYARGARAGLGEGAGAWRSRFDPGLEAAFWASAGPAMEALGYARGLESRAP